MYTIAEKKGKMDNSMSEKSWKVISCEKTETKPTDVANGSIAIVTDKTGEEPLGLSVFCEETSTWGDL